jgi:glycosyltransferase involved in cell wall biosynthesis
MKLTVIVTVFNEKNTIIEAIKEARGLNIDKEVIAIDNCSDDGTVEILKGIKDDSIKIIFQPQNYGYGQSVRTGASIAKGEFIYVHYSDLEYGIASVYDMLDLIEKENLDAVFGSRLYNFRKNMHSVFLLVKERPYYLGTLVTTFLINLFYKRRFTDIIGTKLYRASSFRRIYIESKGISFDFEVASKFCKNRFKIKEVPVSYKPRSSRKGKKVKAIDIIPAIIKIFKVKFFK